jgi:hypothetical protein
VAGRRQEAYHEDGSPQDPPFLTSVEWLTVYRVVDRKIVEATFLSAVHLASS